MDAIAEDLNTADLETVSTHIKTTDTLAAPVMTPEVIANFRKQIQSRYIALGMERDLIRRLLDELTDLEDICEEAYDCLCEADDALSKVV